LVRNLLWRLQGERLLFRTYKPVFQEPERDVGRIVDHDGRFYLITRRVEGRPVRLQRGGSVEEWQVWGRPAKTEELRDRAAG
jgi:hypothetical protein